MLISKHFKSTIFIIITLILGPIDLNAMSMPYHEYQETYVYGYDYNTTQVVLAAGIGLLCLVAVAVAVKLIRYKPFNFFKIKSDEAPIIEHFEWGLIVVKYPGGSKVTYSEKLKPNGGNCIIWPKGSKFWDWTITNTHHNPGIQIADVKELVDEADVIILSQGIDLALQVPQETIDYLEKLGKKVYVAQSELAAKLYNQHVAEGLKVAILLHSTC